MRLTFVTQQSCTQGRAGSLLAKTARGICRGYVFRLSLPDRSAAPEPSAGICKAILAQMKSLAESAGAVLPRRFDCQKNLDKGFLVCNNISTASKGAPLILVGGTFF